MKGMTTGAATERDIVDSSATPPVRLKHVTQVPKVLSWMVFALVLVPMRDNGRVNCITFELYLA